MKRPWIKVIDSKDQHYTFNNLANTQLHTDQMERVVTLPKHPQRIISLVPSQTELLFYLGLKEEVVGITKFCVHPKEISRTKTRVGGTKKFNFDVIAQLKPDLIIGNKEENEKDQIEGLMELYPVWMSNMTTITDALSMISQIGQLIGKEKEAETLVNNVKKEHTKLKSIAGINKGKKAAYFIWRNPYMGAASGTFINNMLHLCGLTNAFAHLSRYPVITEQQLQDANPDLILLSSEPYPFKEKHVAEFATLCPQAEIKIVDGEMFSWYGNRMLYAPEYFLNIFKK